MEDKSTLDSSERAAIIYDLSADAACKFENGEVIKINKTVLSLQSRFFMNEFFGSPPKDLVKIANFDRDTFKTFLDCLFGVREYTILDALLIYPIAHQYGVKKCLKKCAAVLSPKEMSENVCLTLNLALFYENVDVVAKVIEFIKSEIGIIGLMETPDYRRLLEPAAVSKILENIQLHSFVWKLVYDWGRDYLKEQNRSDDINLFLKESDILSKLQLSTFESVESVFDFLKVTNGTMSDSKDVFSYLESQFGKKIPNQSEWFELDRTRIVETIRFSHPFITFSEKISHEIFANNVFIENNNKNRDLNVEVTVKYTLRVISVSVEKKKVKEGYFRSKSSCSSSVATANTLKVFTANKSQLNIAALPEKPAQEAVFCIIKKGKDKDKDKNKGKDAELNEGIEIKSVEITYDFSHFDKVKILRTSVVSDNFRSSDELYFTKNVILKEV